MWKHQQIVDRPVRIADRLGKGSRRLHREAAAEQRRIKRNVAAGQGARRGVAERPAEAKSSKKLPALVLVMAIIPHKMEAVRRCFYSAFFGCHEAREIAAKSINGI
jgi:hypothetical protein